MAELRFWRASPMGKKTTTTVLPTARTERSLGFGREQFSPEFTAEGLSRTALSVGFYFQTLLVFMNQWLTFENLCAGSAIFVVSIPCTDSDTQ